ncbi:MAG: M48 family metalloprotease [Elainellaceae cyanobacterium]
MASHRSGASLLGGAVAFTLVTVFSPAAIAEDHPKSRESDGIEAIGLTEAEPAQPAIVSLHALPQPNVALSDTSIALGQSVSLPEFGVEPPSTAAPWIDSPGETWTVAQVGGDAVPEGTSTPTEEAVESSADGETYEADAPSPSPLETEATEPESTETSPTASQADGPAGDEDSPNEAEGADAPDSGNGDINIEPDADEAAEEDGGESTGAETADSEESLEEDPEAAAEEAARQRRLELFSEGDRLFELGRYAEAEVIYRSAKGDFEGEVIERAEPILDPEQLSPAGQVYWREYQAGLESGLDTRIDVPLQLLTQENPEFIPGHLSYAERLNQQEQPEAAIAVLERAATLYPNDLTLTQARIDALVAQEEWLQAAIAARQFALINPEEPASAELAVSADEYQDRFRRRMRSRITRNAIGNVLAGGIGFALTGNIFGPLSALQTSILLMRGEAAVGERTAQRAAEELELITDEEVVTYVNELGQELAELGGRDEFEYEFYIVAADELNAFALPGGKVFINAGAILKTETTAEFAGLVAHELSHAILSHGFQIMTGGNLVANVLRVVPYGGVATNLAVLSYSRDMERQADRLGTRMLAASPYAADGMARLMETLEEENPRGNFDWLSTHPDTPERIRRLNSLIEANGYNRYAYEGVDEHQRIQERVRRILIQAGVLLELDENGEPIDPEAVPEAETEENSALDDPSAPPDAGPDATGPDATGPETEPEAIEAPLAPVSPGR